jgi:hypothetical protein
MAIHNFIIMAEHTDNFLTDEFFKDGLTIMREERTGHQGEKDNRDDQSASSTNIELLREQIKWEQLKEALLETLHDCEAIDIDS